MLNKIRQITNEQAVLERQIKANAEMAVKGSALAKQAVEQDLAATYKLRLEKEKLNREITEMAKRTNQVGMSFKQFIGQPAVIQSLAFAADDAAASFGTGGWSGAIRGAANNLSLIAMMASPTIGAITGIGLAIGGGFIKQWEDSAKAIDNSRESMDKSRESAAQYRKQIMELSASVAELSGEEAKAAEIRLQKRREEMLSKPKTELMEALQKQGGVNRSISAIDREIAVLRQAKPGSGEEAQAIGQRISSLVKQRETLADQQAEADDDVRRRQSNFDATVALLDQEEQARQQKAGRDRVNAFAKQFRRGAAELAGGLQKGFADRVKSFDPLEIQLNQTRMDAKKARIAADQERFDAMGPARPQFRGDREGVITPEEMEAIRKLDHAAQALQIAAEKLELQKAERERDNNINRRPGG